MVSLPLPEKRSLFTKADEAIGRIEGVGLEDAKTSKLKFLQLVLDDVRPKEEPILRALIGMAYQGAIGGRELPQLAGRYDGESRKSEVFLPIPDGFTELPAREMRAYLKHAKDDLMERLQTINGKATPMGTGDQKEVGKVDVLLFADERDAKVAYLMLRALADAQGHPNACVMAEQPIDRGDEHLMHMVLIAPEARISILESEGIKPKKFVEKVSKPQEVKSTSGLFAIASEALSRSGAGKKGMQTMVLRGDKMQKFAAANLAIVAYGNACDELKKPDMVAECKLSDDFNTLSIPIPKGMDKLPVLVMKRHLHAMQQDIFERVKEAQPLPHDKDKRYCVPAPLAELDSFSGLLMMVANAYTNDPVTTMPSDMMTTPLVIISEAARNAILKHEKPLARGRG